MYITKIRQDKDINVSGYELGAAHFVNGYPKIQFSYQGFQRRNLEMATINHFNLYSLYIFKIIYLVIVTTTPRKILKRKFINMTAYEF